MRPLKIRLIGEYWDSFLYDDKLLLLTREGTLEIYSWDRILDSLELGESLEAPLRHLAGRGRAWYGLAVQDLIHHGPIKPELVRSVQDLSKRVLKVSRDELRRKRRHEVQVDLFPSTDLEVYGSVLFLGSTDGVVAAPLTDIEHMDLSRRSLLIDAPALKISASYRHLAIAHGSDGLSEVPVGRFLDYDQADGTSNDRLISSQSCHSCSWASFDIVGSTPGAGGYVSAFSKPQQGEVEYYEREFLGTVASEQVFGNSGGLLFGSGNLLMLARDGELRTERWNPFRRREDFGVDLDRSLFHGSELARRTKESEPLDAAVTVFATVLELDDHLVVYGSDGQIRIIKGEPIAWRVFPRSTRYPNHLHVVKQGFLDVYVFTHDYFVAPADRSTAMNRPRASTW